ncbi:hypothetical protein SHYC_05310 [Staphylococcus hyicus]|uniref:hypothetical protein n=2 Tax=Staphylococcus hyicus TaxID=1284 RepID=UPI000581E4C9|nr:hypothetical protein [Staphylococcus hyicus]AJC95818.1 hypothetical protein SHYC_05310 [Staphylococcus hyicus]SQE47316.1 phage protein [Staphylococcus hyicus]
MDYQQQKMKNFYILHRDIATQLTIFIDKCEEALLSGEGMDEVLEYIGIKSDELLQKL